MNTNKIAELTSILPPPENPLDLDEAMLQRAERVLRIKFPTDFLEFSRTYGSGTIKAAYSWEVWSAFRPTYPLLILEFSRIWNIYRDATEIRDVPFGIFPEVGGLLPFSRTPNGDWVCWRTVGEPDTWDVVDMGEYSMEACEVLGMSFSEYFVSVLNRKHILQRHQNGNVWDPQKDLTFKQRVFADQGL